MYTMVLYFFCDLCEYKATSQPGVRIHKRIQHEDVGKNCDKCDFKTSWTSVLSRHKQRKHSV